MPNDEEDFPRRPPDAPYFADVTEASEALRKAIEAVGGLVTSAELARRWVISNARAHEITSRDDFPKPVGQVGRSPVWAYDECEEWRDRDAERPPGRPPRQPKEDREP